VQGGISNGETVIIRVAFKPTSTIGQEQHTVTRVRPQEFSNIFSFDCMEQS
jgi:chorismate synthase